jgi:hypothetical protein
VRSALARAAGRGQLVPSITQTGRLSPSVAFASDRANNPRNADVSIDPSLNASQVLGQRRRNTVVRLSRTRVLRCEDASIASWSSNRLS